MIENKNTELNIIKWSNIEDIIAPTIMMNSYVYVACTDKVYWLQILNDAVNDIRFDRLLELRIFNNQGEFRISRHALDEDFKKREIVDDEELSDEDYFDQWQYLDIDANSIQKGSFMVASINGGTYTLPVEAEENLQIKVRNYVKYNEIDGQARVYDWRLVEFGKGDK